MGPGKLGRREIARGLVGVSLVLVTIVAGGCNRSYYRRQADKEVNAILQEKDQYPAWKIENYHIYPDPRARFADPTNPDRPPAPPDDPAARLLAPTPQRPGKAGVAWVEGTGYLNLLANWDAENRAAEATRRAFTDIDVAAVKQAAWTRQEEKRDKLEIGPEPKLPPEAFPGVTRPFLLRLDQAVELGLINSREYQTRREDLYLAALPVTLERFSFSTQFFAFEEAIRQRSGRETTGGYGNFWQVNSTLGFSKLFSTGALVLAAFANQTVVNLTGADRHTVSTSTVNLDLIQPLLRGGGRAVTLEPLTQAERNLLYEVRSYARFRKVFFQYITGGLTLSSLGAPAAPRGVDLAIGRASLGAGNPAGFSILPGSPTRLDLSTLATLNGNGYLPALLSAGILQNENKNVQALEGLLKYFEAIEEGGDISALQVDQVRLQLLQGKQRVLQQEQDLRDSLDAFKLQLGIPITVPLQLDDQVLAPIAQQLGRFEEIIDQSEAVIREVVTYDAPDQAPQLRQKLRKLLTESAFVKKTVEFREKLPGRWAEWEKMADKALAGQLEMLRAERRKLLDEKSDAEEKGMAWPADHQKRYAFVDRQIALGDLEASLRRYEGQPWKREAKEKERSIVHVGAFRDVRNAFALVLGEASNERLREAREKWKGLPPVLVDGVDLIRDDLERAYEVVARNALANRLDLMNARAQVVDAWREIAVFANSLLGTFNVGYHVDSKTPPDEAKPLAFAGSRTRHQLFFSAELPLVRLAERNAYRASLIAYQRARRDLMSLEDQIVTQVRQDLRQLRVLAETFKIQQQSVELAYTQVESSLETFRAPPDPRQVGGGGNAGNAAALTQQLLNAQRSLPQTQNQLYTIWLNYHVARQQLFLDLEMMPLDYRGVWIDEHAYPESHTVGAGREFERGSALPAGLERQRARLLPPS